MFSVILMYVNEKAVVNMEDTLKIAADKTRLKILFSLLEEIDSTKEGREIEKCVNDIAIQIGASQSLVSHQLKVLKEGDFVKTRKDGTKIYYSLADEHVREIMRVTYEHVMERINDD